MIIRSPAGWCAVYDEIRSKIKSGSLRAESEIHRSQVCPNASDVDFQRALDRLKDEGLLKVSDGEEVLIAKPRARSRRTTSFIVDYAKQGRIPSISTILFEIIPLRKAPEFVVGHLEGAGVDMLVRHLHVQSVDGEPHAISDSFVPYDIVKDKYEDIARENGDLYRILEELGYGVTEKEECLYVDRPTMEERKMLSIDEMPALPIVRLDCVVRSESKIVELCMLCDRSDLYEFHYKITL